MTMKNIVFTILTVLLALPTWAQGGDVYERSKEYEWPTDPLVVESCTSGRT